MATIGMTGFHGTLLSNFGQAKIFLALFIRNSYFGANVLKYTPLYIFHFSSSSYGHKTFLSHRLDCNMCVEYDTDPKMSC